MDRSSREAENDSDSYDSMKYFVDDNQTNNYGLSTENLVLGNPEQDNWELWISWHSGPGLYNSGSN